MVLLKLNDSIAMHATQEQRIGTAAGNFME